MTATRLTLACVLLTLLSACPSARDLNTPGALDLSGVTDARFNEEYLGQVAVADYSGTARFDRNSGEWPLGLDMDAAGRITGVAEYVETRTVEVLVTGLEGIEDFVGSVTVGVTAAFVEDVFLGYEHDQLNNMIDHPSFEYMSNIWVRLSGVGIDDMSQWTMRPGLYLPGPNGAVEDGRGDDVRIGDLAFEDLEWSFEGWTPTLEENTYPPDYPSDHLPEDDAPTVSTDGVFAAGVDGGQGDFTATHPDFPNTISRKLQVVPPDWCPTGKSPGGWDADGACVIE